jgi:glycopeptide antibiotics resistance protein
MNSQGRPPRRLKLLLVFALAGVLAFFALRRSPYLQYIPGMPRAVGVWADSNGVVRNTAAFFVLALAVYLLVGRRGRHVVAAGLFASAIEVAQIWVRGRVFDWRDIVASLAGILLAWPVAWCLRARPAPRR